MCSCFSRGKAGDGRGIAHDTIRAISGFYSQTARKPVNSAITVTITTALVLSISLFLDVLGNEVNDQEESERISVIIEEGYNLLMELAPTCKFASSAVSSVDERLFSTEDNFEHQSVESRLSPVFGADGTYNEEVVPGRLPAGGTPFARNDRSGHASMEIERRNNPLDDLQAGYGDLDTVSPDPDIRKRGR